ncbi:ash family protein [Salmonella enterica]|nr:ash family protein [Salmonella enterica]EJM8644471.1 ash family protein [Salmonella enterica]EJR1668085.1 ash family protein [Salmonella enterica]ELB4164554.1 ash family protein [Salmonella enterica]ELY8178365.1 ash family protein [Salmonella enterica]
MGYISAAPHKTGAGICTPPNKIAHNRASGFFTRKASSRLFRIMAGRMGPLSGGPVSILSGSANPVRLATPSFAPLGGELPFIKIGAPSWQIANSAALMRIASAPRPKSTAACAAQNNWRIACISSPSAITVSWYNCVYRQRSVIWQTTCRNFKNWRERRENNPPESLKQTRHSASGRWWGVALHDIQEAL